MTGLYLGVLAAAFVSAFLPVVPVEAWLVAATAAGPHGVAVGVLAGVGQSAGKLVIFLSVRGALRSGRLQGWIAAALRRRHRPERTPEGRRPGRLRSAGARLVALLDRPAFGVPVIFLSGVTGLPPLLVASVYAARTAMGAPAFGLSCLAGRSIRFMAIGLLPGLVLS